jgi:hypothetical protein
MRLVKSAALTIVLPVVLAPVLATVFAVGTTSVAAAQTLTAEKPKPFNRLFLLPNQRELLQPLPPQRRGSAPAPAPAPTGRPSVSCGTTVVPVNPAFDAPIRRVAPVAPKPSSRTIPAPACETVKR